LRLKSRVTRWEQSSAYVTPTRPIKTPPSEDGRAI
jgi:hypothetical protein